MIRIKCLFSPPLATQERLELHPLPSKSEAPLVIDVLRDIHGVYSQESWYNKGAKVSDLVLLDAADGAFVNPRHGAAVLRAETGIMKIQVTTRKGWKPSPISVAKQAAKRCGSCKRSFPKRCEAKDRGFADRQWRKPDGLRCCRECAQARQQAASEATAHSGSAVKDVSSPSVLDVPRGAVSSPKLAETWTVVSGLTEAKRRVQCCYESPPPALKTAALLSDFLASSGRSAPESIPETWEVQVQTVMPTGAFVNGGDKVVWLLTEGEDGRNRWLLSHIFDDVALLEANGTEMCYRVLIRAQ